MEAIIFIVGTNLLYQLNDGVAGSVERQLKRMGPGASGSFYSSLRNSPFHRFGPCSSLCLELPYGPSFWLSRPTKVLPSVYTIYLWQPIQPLLSTRCPKRTEEKVSQDFRLTIRPRYRQHELFCFVLRWISCPSF